MVNRRRYYRRRKGFFASMTLNNILILINVLVFVLIALLVIILGVDLTSVEAFENSFVKYLALSPSLFVQGFVWTLLTSMFIHGGFAHLFVNMISMFFIGDLVERLIGKKRYLWFYISFLNKNHKQLPRQALQNVLYFQQAIQKLLMLPTTQISTNQPPTT